MAYRIGVRSKTSGRAPEQPYTGAGALTRAGLILWVRKIHNGLTALPWTHYRLRSWLLLMGKRAPITRNAPAVCREARRIYRDTLTVYRNAARSNQFSPGHHQKPRGDLRYTARTARINRRSLTQIPPLCLVKPPALYWRFPELFRASEGALPPRGTSTRGGFAHLRRGAPVGLCGALCSERGSTRKMLLYHAVATLPHEPLSAERIV